MAQLRKASIQGRRQRPAKRPNIAYKFGPLSPRWLSFPSSSLNCNANKPLKPLAFG